MFCGWVFCLFLRGRVCVEFFLWVMVSCMFVQWDEESEGEGDGGEDEDVI